MDAFKIGYASLNEYQKEVYNECIKKGSGGISLPMGFGKTRLSLVIVLGQMTESGVSLVVVSKSLLESWKAEIKKCFGGSLKYQVLHRDVVKDINSWTIEKDTRVVLTTIDVISGLYKNKGIEKKLVSYEDVVVEGGFPHREIFYNRVKNPMCLDKIGPGILYSIKFECLIVDEVQKFTNISSDRCRGLVSLYVKNRWVLSGTMFDEPKACRILGYYMIINHNSFPRNLPSASRYITSNTFKGVRETIITRDKNEAYSEPKSNTHIIVNELNETEEKIYMSMKKLMRKIQEKAKFSGNKETRRKFSSYLLAMITYLRQCVISPLIPIASMALDMYDTENKSILSTLFMNEIKELNIDSYLNDRKNLISTRIEKILDTIDKHKNEKIVLFSGFRKSLDLLTNIIKERKVSTEATEANRNVVTISSSMSMKQRIEVVDKFNKTDDNTILLLTYEIGGEGLNLQSSSTVLLIDFWWNSAKTKQAIARVLRFGQKNTVNIYYFTGNTAIENVILEKQDLKLEILAELQNGKITKKLASCKMDEIVKLINTEDNINKIQKIY
jgi:SNF2 family DNA or RNA helicase